MAEFLTGAKREFDRHELLYLLCLLVAALNLIASLSRIT